MQKNKRGDRKVGSNDSSEIPDRGGDIRHPRPPFGGPFRETFRKRYVVERTNKAEIRLGEQSENTDSCRENLWNEIQVKGP